MAKQFYGINEFANLKVSQSKIEVTNVTSSTALTQALGGDYIFVTSTTGTALTLPTPAGNSGLAYHITIGATASSHSIVAPTASIVGSLSAGTINTAGTLSTGSAKTSITSTVGSAIGDSIHLVSNGTLWYLSGNLTNSHGVSFA